MADIEEVEQGETIVLEAVFTNRANSGVDPSVSQTINIVHKKDGTVVKSAEAMVDLSGVDGGWKYHHQVAADAPLGEYIAQGVGSDGATPDVSRGRVSFTVVPSLV